MDAASISPTILALDLDRSRKTPRASPIKKNTLSPFAVPAYLVHPGEE